MAGWARVWLVETTLLYRFITNIKGEISYD